MEAEPVLLLNIRRLSVIVMGVPLLGIVVCFVTANYFHEDINHTRCPVYNFIPSVSAVTGVSPQRYLWRLCVALHIVPRALFAWLCRQNAARAAGAILSASRRRLYCRLVVAAFALNMLELFSLAGVTFVSNKENYPLHEKMFSAFIGSCTAYMVVALAMDHMTADGGGSGSSAITVPDGHGGGSGVDGLASGDRLSTTAAAAAGDGGGGYDSSVSTPPYLSVTGHRKPEPLKALVVGGEGGRARGGGGAPQRRPHTILKWLVFGVYSTLVLALLYNFWKHRFYCEELAFSCFAFCEYCVCVCVMVFHLLVLRELPDLWLTVTPAPTLAAPAALSHPPNGHLTHHSKCD